MSKSVIRSAKPYWIYLILTGKKKVEVGKNFPKSKDWNKIVEMYCSKDMRSFNRIPEKDREWMRKYLGKVACQFVCDRIDWLHLEDLTIYEDAERALKGTCFTKIDIMQYLNYTKGTDICDDYDKWNFYGWHISDLVIYDEPRELGEFKIPCPRMNAINGDCNFCKHFEISRYGKMTKCNASLNRPPQSWYYIEEE